MKYPSLPLAICGLTLLAAALPVAAADRSKPSPTTTARMTGVKPEGSRLRGKTWRGADVPARRHGSDHDVRTANEGRKPAAAKIRVRKP